MEYLIAGMLSLLLAKGETGPARSIWRGAAMVWSAMAIIDVVIRHLPGAAS